MITTTNEGETLITFRVGQKQLRDWCWLIEGVLIALIYVALAKGGHDG